MEYEGNVDPQDAMDNLYHDLKDNIDKQKQMEQDTFLTLPNLEGLPSSETQQPTMYNLDATKVRNFTEVGILINAIGLQATEEFAKTYNLEHLLVK